jgi:hypothetical protein
VLMNGALGPSVVDSKLRVNLPVTASTANSWLSWAMAPPVDCGFSSLKGTAFSFCSVCARACFDRRIRLLQSWTSLTQFAIVSAIEATAPEKGPGAPSSTYHRLCRILWIVSPLRTKSFFRCTHNLMFRGLSLPFLQSTATANALSCTFVRLTLQTAVRSGHKKQANF